MTIFFSKANSQNQSFSMILVRYPTQRMVNKEGENLAPGMRDQWKEAEGSERSLPLFVADKGLSLLSYLLHDSL